MPNLGRYRNASSARIPLVYCASCSRVANIDLAELAQRRRWPKSNSSCTSAFDGALSRRIVRSSRNDGSGVSQIATRCPPFTGIVNETIRGRYPTLRTSTMSAPGCTGSKKNWPFSLVDVAALCTTVETDRALHDVERRVSDDAEQSGLFRFAADRVENLRRFLHRDGDIVAARHEIDVERRAERARPGARS